MCVRGRKADRAEEGTVTVLRGEKKGLKKKNNNVDYLIVDSFLVNVVVTNQRILAALV